jgi:hypothetical protein
MARRELLRLNVANKGESHSPVLTNPAEPTEILYDLAVETSTRHNDWLRLHGPYEDAMKGRGEQP